MACKRSGVRIPIAPPGHEHISKTLPMTRSATEGHLRGTPAGGRIADLREREVSAYLAVGEQGFHDMQEVMSPGS